MTEKYHFKGDGIWAELEKGDLVGYMKNSKIDSLDRGNKLRNYSIVKVFMFPSDRKKDEMI